MKILRGDKIYKKLIRILICVIIIFHITIAAQSRQDINNVKNTNLVFSIDQSNTTWYVGGDGPGNFTHIYKAIDEASDGDTIFVYSGTYREGFTIDKSIILRGEDKETTKIVGGASFTINVNANNVLIQNFTIDRDWSSSYNSNYGIEISEDNATIYDVILTNNTRGIRLGFSNNHTIFNNIFYNNGIFLFNSFNNNINNNLINGKKLEYLEKTSNIIIKPDTGQVILVNCTNITVKNLDLSNTNVGAQLINTNNCHLINNRISKATSGIYFDYSKYNTISKNNISYCQFGDGIHIDFSSSNNNIKNNILFNNSLNGIEIRDSCNNTISNNVLKNNYCGITCHFRCSRDNIISNNIIADNENYGVRLDCSNNIVCNNILSNNPSGGIHVDSYEHLILNNTFYNDGLNVRSSYSTYKDNQIENNTINGRSLVFLNDISNKIIDNAGQIILIRCNDVIIENQRLNDTFIGLTLIETNNCFISENNINSNNLHGIRMFDSHSNTITKNSISYNSEDGIFVEHSDQNLISNNHICNNYDYGIYVYDYIEWGWEYPETSKHNSFIKNNIMNNIESDASFLNSIFNRWSMNFWGYSKKIHPIIGEIYLERGWHFGAPPPIDLKFCCFDWNPAQKAYDIQ